MKKLVISLLFSLILISMSFMVMARNLTPKKHVFYVRNYGLWDYCGNPANTKLICRYYIKVNERVVAQSKTSDYRDYQVSTAIAYSNNPIVITIGRHSINSPDSQKTFNVVLGNCFIAASSDPAGGPVAICNGWCGNTGNFKEMSGGHWFLYPYYGENVYPVSHYCRIPLSLPPRNRNFS